ncbi:hypothetical protein PUN28_000827 [Cardiocondyla obscurior]|uniref:Eclosion hormone n=1 Tax=Cardiocondyla obscurior TaxID=286306 RepID=A0AAW2H1G9_9HYME
MSKSSNRIIFLLVIIFATFCFASTTDAVRNVGVCIRNCEQCRKMFGAYFMGEKCMDSCIKYKGKFIPDCEDDLSIHSFLSSREAENDIY